MSESITTPNDTGLNPETQRSGAKAKRHGAEGVTNPDSSVAGPVFSLGAIVTTAFLTAFTTEAVALTIAIMGLIVLAFPPRRRIPVLPCVSIVIFCLYPLSTLLPQSWAGPTTDWRTALYDNWGIQLADTISPQPQVTLGATLMVWATAIFLTASVGQAHSGAGRRRGLQLIAVGIALVCAASVADFRDWISIPWWPRSADWGEGFGPFANRNHLATLAAVGSVLSVGCVYDSLRRRSQSALLFAVGFVPCAAAITMNTSRAGLLLSLLGLVMWVSFAAMRRGLIRKVAVGTAVFLIGVAVVGLSQTKLTERLGFGEETTDLGSLTRLELYADSLRMAVTHPWTGLGLGNFVPVFNHLTELSDPRTTFLHPESDFIQLMVGGGLGMAISAAVVVGWFVLQCGPWIRQKSRTSQDRLDRRLRRTASIAAILMLLHAMVDVPLHGIRFAVIFTCLCGFAVPRRELVAFSSPWVPVCFRVMGTGLLCYAALISEVWRGFLPVVPGNLAADIRYRQAAEHAADAKLGDAQDALGEALIIRPLDWKLYYLRAQLRLATRSDVNGALQDFGRARYLEPHYADMCDHEGRFWLRYEPSMAIPAWREALRRRPDAAPGIHGWFRQWLRLTAPFPKVNDALWDLADTPALKLDVLSQPLSPSEWNKRLASLLADQDSTDGLGPSHLTELFQLWQSRGDREQLAIELQRRPEWEEHGWRFLATDFAGKSQFKEAYELAVKWLPPTPPPNLSPNADLASLERSFVFSPTDPRTGMELYWAQMKLGLYDEALVTLQKLEGLPQAPSYLPQELATVYAAKGDYRQAWESVRKAAQQP